MGSRWDALALTVFQVFGYLRVIRNKYKRLCHCQQCVERIMGAAFQPSSFCDITTDTEGSHKLPFAVAHRRSAHVELYCTSIQCTKYDIDSVCSLEDLTSQNA